MHSYLFKKCKAYGDGTLTKAVFIVNDMRAFKASKSFLNNEVPSFLPSQG